MVKQYGVSQKIYMLICLLRTRLFYRGSRLIRFPFDIRNRKHISLGKHFTSGRNCRLEVCNEHCDKGRICLKLGEEVQINDNVHIAAGQLVEIGNRVLIASRVFISDINHGNFREGEMFDLSVSPEKQTLFFDPVRIEDNVWIGESVCILPGVTIGKHSVVGALSCVTKSIPPYSIAVGNPARVVKQYNFQTCSWERV